MRDKPDIYSYIDYRRYLKDMYTYCKATEAGFSFRAFSGRAGFSAPNTLKLVLDGQRGLTDASFRKVAKGFGLDAAERRYLKHMLAWDDARTTEARQHAEAMLQRLQRRHGIRKLSGDAYAYLSSWTPVAIRELLGLAQAPQQLRRIQVALWPKPTVPEIRQALALLHRLGLLEKTKAGWRPKHAVVATEDDIKDAAARGYHRDMIGLAREALDALPQDKRNVGAITAAIHHDQFARLAAFLQGQRRELTAFLQKLQDERAGDQIVQINFQAFPLSKPLDKVVGNVRKPKQK